MATEWHSITGNYETNILAALGNPHQFDRKFEKHFHADAAHSEIPEKAH